MRFWRAFTLGTISAFAVTGVLVWSNGTPVPPWRDWQGVASYPTGSALTYFGLLWVIYAFWITVTARWRRRKLLPVPAPRATRHPVDVPVQEPADDRGVHVSGDQADQALQLHFAFLRCVTSGHISPSVQVLQVSHQKRPEHLSRLLNPGGCQEWECGKIACPSCPAI